MAALIEKQQIEVKNLKTEQAARVPNSPVAKLMYYLDCVCQCVSTDASSMQRLRDYQSNYTKLTQREQATLLDLCTTLSPDKLIGKVFFRNEKMQERNQFLEISTVSMKLEVSQTLMIGGTQQTVKRVMMFKNEWMETYYVQPNKELQTKKAIMAPTIARQQETTPTKAVLVIEQHRQFPPALPMSTQNTRPSSPILLIHQRIPPPASPVSKQKAPPPSPLLVLERRMPPNATPISKQNASPPPILVLERRTLPTAAPVRPPPAPILIMSTPPPRSSPAGAPGGQRNSPQATTNATGSPNTDSNGRRPVVINCCTML